MKFEIFGKTPSEPMLRLSFKHNDSDGSVTVIVVDEDGEIRDNGHLIRFYLDGTFHRCHGVNDAFGFKLDAKGRIEES